MTKINDNICYTVTCSKDVKYMMSTYAWVLQMFSQVPLWGKISLFHSCLLQLCLWGKQQCASTRGQNRADSGCGGHGQLGKWATWRMECWDITKEHRTFPKTSKYQTGATFQRASQCNRSTPSASRSTLQSAEPLKMQNWQKLRLKSWQVFLKNKELSNSHNIFFMTTGSIDVYSFSKNLSDILCDAVCFTSFHFHTPFDSQNPFREQNTRSPDSPHSFWSC